MGQSRSCFCSASFGSTDIAFLSVTLDWCLYELSKHPEVQEKLREELSTVTNDRPTLDELNALPYLDMVVRENLRLHAATASTTRRAMKDDVIPLASPIIDKNGVLRSEIR